MAQQLLNHEHVHKLLPSLQFAYRAQHSTETAVIKVLLDILTAADHGDLSMLTLLDLSAAFDTVDHPILLRHLMTSHSVNGVVLFTRGSVRTSPTALSTFAVLDPGRLHYWCCVESRRVRSWGRHSFFYIQWIWYSWWNPLNCIRTLC